MSNQLQATGAVKVRSLTGVLIGTSGVVTSLNIDGSLGIPQLDVNGKILVSQLPNSVMEYKGTWDASTNTPTLVNGTGNQGDVYLCNVAGTVNFGAGAIAFFVGDQVIYSGSIWQRASGATGTVTSVAVTETGDSLNITGSPITTSGTINIGFNGTNLQYVNGAGNLTTFPILTGYVPYTGATTDLNLGANLLKFTTEASDNASIGTSVSGSSSYFDFNLSDDNNQEEWRFRFTPSGGSVYDAVRIRPVSATASDLLVSGSIGAANFSGASGGTNTGDVTLGTANGLSLASQVLSLAAASASVTGALTSTDWSSFNSKVSSQWTTSGSDIFYNTGNVCVNTTTSGVGRFFVAADTDSGITIRNTGTADRFQLFVGSTGGATYTADNAIIKGTNTAIDFYNGSTATKKVTIPNSGNYLEVYGDAYVQSYVKIGNGSGNYTALTTIASGTKIVTFPNAAGTVALTSDIPSLTGYVPYTGATQDVDLGAFKLNAQSLHAKGTAGNGHLGLKHQSASATASANEVSLFADSLGDLSWQNGNLYLSKFITSSNTAARSYTFPNANGTVALTSDFSGYVPYTGATTNLDMGANGLYANNLTIRKISTSATIDFPNTGTMNDPAFIKHTESPDNTAVMSFSVGDNDATNDYFVFGNASSGFVERFKITATGVVTIGTWNGTAIGDTYISSAATWNGKVSSVSATSPVVSSGGTTPTISMAAATTSVSGYLTSTDWTTFNNKGTFTLPSLTSGSVLFSNGSTIAQDNANFFWDDTNNRLGIGNAAPSHPLDVTGIIKGSTSIYATNDLFIGDTTGSATGRLIITDSSNQGINIRRNNAVSERFKLFVGNGTTYTQDNGIILGVNTDIDFYTGASPVKRLTIANSGVTTIKGDGESFIQQANSVNSAIFHSFYNSASTRRAYLGYGSNSSSNFNVWNQENGDILFGTNNTERMRITSAGIVQITGNSGSLVQQAGTVGGDVFHEFKNSAGTRRGYLGFGGASSSTFDISNNDNGDIVLRGTAERLRLTSGGYVLIPTGVSGTSYFAINYTTVDSRSRLWRIGSDQNQYGDFSIQQATTQGGSSFVERLQITYIGNVGLSRTATTNTLEVNGDASKSTAGLWAANSDINIKTDINTIEGALDRINKVRLVKFKYKDAYKENNRGIKDIYYHNVIAQEFKEVYADYVYDSGDLFEEKEVLQVDTTPMYIDSVSAIQELSKMVIDLQNQINELKNK